MADHDLSRFVEAQAPVRAAVVRELERGRKESHWMWFVFPQLAGLGHSAMAQYYGITGVDEAQRYLADPVLGERLRSDVRLMLGHREKSAADILGPVDDLKFRSCLTLFGTAASDPADRALFAEALQQFYAGKEDARTLDLLGNASP